MMIEQMKLDGVPEGSQLIESQHPLVQRAYLTLAGNEHVILVDESQATWEAYCHAQRLYALTPRTEVFKSIALTDFRTRMRQIMNAVNLHRKRFVFTQHGKPTGYCIPIGDFPTFDSMLKNFQKTRSMNVTQFRDELTQCFWDLETDTDCLFLSFHKKQIAVMFGTRKKEILEGWYNTTL